MIGLAWLAWRRQRWAVLITLGVVLFYAFSASVRTPALMEMAWHAGAFADPAFVLPIGFGACWAAPLLAREQQNGTVDLAYTQSVTRAGWLVAWIAPVLVSAILGTLAVDVALRRLIEPGELAAWDFRAYEPMLLTVGWVVCAVAMGLCVGAVVGRTVPAMAATVVGILALPYVLRIVLLVGRQADSRVEVFVEGFAVSVLAALTAALLVGAFGWMIRRVPRS
ncbi:hypothetical protein [Cryptosporangium minutisporangium]|uniref:ABC transporter permease n=1 Tax=Cryptosporangium minutisporangium TaxID=113569 RepID=A0ABP6TCP5_9ACTN